MARQKLNFDEEEVREIINLKLMELDGDTTKLTANSVRTFNEKIANNPIYKRANGELYTKYSYTFWIDKNYFGNQEVMRIKNENGDFTLVGDCFAPESQDIQILVSRHGKNLPVLTEKLIVMLENDKKELYDLRNQLGEMKKKYDKVVQELESFKQSFATIFMNSAESINSLNNAVTLKNEGDIIIHDELKTMFSDDWDNFKSIIENNSLPPSKDESIKLFNKTEEDFNVIDLNERLAELEDEGF